MLAVIFACFFHTSILLRRLGFLAVEWKLHFNVVMDFIVCFEDYLVVERWICLVLLDPLLLDRFFFRLMLFFPLVEEFLGTEIEEKFLIWSEVLQSVFVLFDLTAHRQNFLIEFFNFLVLLGFLAFQLLLFLFLLLFDLLVFCNVLMQVELIIFKFLSRFNERLVPSLLPFFQFFDLLLHNIVCELCQEHFFFLIDEFSGVLSALLLRELDSRLRYHHGTINDFSLWSRVGCASFLASLVFLCRWNISVLNSV